MRALSADSGVRENRGVAVAIFAVSATTFSMPPRSSMRARAADTWARMTWMAFTVFGVTVDLLVLGAVVVAFIVLEDDGDSQFRVVVLGRAGRRDGVVANAFASRPLRSGRIVSSVEDAPAGEEQEVDTLAALAQLITASLDDVACARLVEKLADPFPWIAVMPTAARRGFIREFLATA